ncbi:MAG: stage 0 sporulation family protein [Lachnospiraceae bacterium]|nr:stage 0 sporulation family protein [Lachnospiraceae bacterium]
MISIIGVRFRQAGKVYYFDPVEFEVERGSHVIVETARGVEYGTVVLEKREIEETPDMPPVKPIIRLATAADEERVAANAAKEKEALAQCAEKVTKHGLDMKLISCEYTFDGSKLLFYFTADGRVDFRELVKDLATVFHTRIELRQIGVRDEAKLRGGIGICGRELCCHTYLSDFIPVSVKMAKEQNLSLNPTKISGNCGRLMCCLKHEEDAYEYLNSRLPNLGETVHTPEGLTGEVTELNVLKQRVKVLVHVNGVDGDEKEIREYGPEELKFRPRKPRKESKEDASEKALKALE